jgi:hypothetical protein
MSKGMSNYVGAWLCWHFLLFGLVDFRFLQNNTHIIGIGSKVTSSGLVVCHACRLGYIVFYSHLLVTKLQGKSIRTSRDEINKLMSKTDYNLTKSKGRILHPKSDAIIKIKCRNQPPKQHGYEVSLNSELLPSFLFLAKYISVVLMVGSHFLSNIYSCLLCRAHLAETIVRMWRPFVVVLSSISP